MLRFVTITINCLWPIGMLACLAVGVQAVGDNKPRFQAKTPANDLAIEDNALPEGKQPKRQRVDAADQAQYGRRQATPMTYGPAGTFITLDEYDRLHPDANPLYRSSQPRPKWRYREPTCTPSRAQLAWARMLPNHGGLAGRGYSDEQIVQHFAPSEVKALEGDEVPEHLRPDLNPQVVFINERCKDGTCTTGYCEASRRNNPCKNGVCPAVGR